MAKLGGLSRLTCLILFLINGVQAAGVCLSGGQLAGVIFGSILGTVAVLGALFAAVFYFRWRPRKGFLSKDIRLNPIGDEPQSQMNSRTATLVSGLPCTHCPTCGATRQENEDVADNNTIAFGAVTQSANNETDQVIGQPPAHVPLNTSPVKIRQTDNAGQSSGEYRTRRNRNSSAFSSWWTRRSTVKQRNSYSMDSLNSVNETVRVELKSRDSNGLGFNICGNSRDGIFIKSLSNRGPAKESCNIKEGDRIISVTVNFENMVFEDALTIISYASAYPVTVEVQRIESAVASKESFNDSIPVGIKSFSNSEKYSTPSKSSRIICHPLFKSQSIEDIRSFPSPTSPLPLHSDEKIEVGRDEGLQRAPASARVGVGRDTEDITAIQSAQKPICALEIIEETPQLPRRSPLMPRILSSDTHSIASSTSLEIDTADNSDQSIHANPTTITVTAEINAAPCRNEENIVLQDPYAGLSYEDRLQIIRLSYDDNYSCSQLRTDSRSTAVAEYIQRVSDTPTSPSPALGKQILSAGEVVRHTNAYMGNEGSPYSNRYENGESLIKVKLQEEDDALSVGDSPSSLDSSTDRNQNRYAVDELASKIRLNSFASPSGSSIGVSSNESDHRNSPDMSKRDSGYDVPVNGVGSATDDEVEREQYEKLLYFQRQLTKQHEELARLGIHLPIGTEAIQKATETGLDHRPKIEAYND